jgi:hypothetical protein
MTIPNKGVALTDRKKLEVQRWFQPFAGGLFEN